MVIEGLNGVNVDAPPAHLAHHMRASSEPTAGAVSDAGGDEGAGGGDDDDDSEITKAMRRYYESDGDGDGGGDGDGDGDGDSDAASEGGVGVVMDGVAGVEESTVDNGGREGEVGPGEVGDDSTINSGDAGSDAGGGDGRDSKGGGDGSSGGETLVEYD